MKSTLAVLVGLAIGIVGVSGLAVERRANIFNVYPTLAPEAAPTVEARGLLFNVYPTLAPEAAPTVEARGRLFNIYPSLAPEDGPKTQV
ncbi:hypothetical protein C8F01DRAFT_6042 [Mycena amicta]|nr:hypothetical protein C8F01DRAFT_6042 [Mycena amicta]